MMEVKRVEGLWDCVFCASKAIRAGLDTCPNCGKPRGEETVFYLPTDIESATLSKEEAEKTTNRPDWLCEYCGAYNRSDAVVCKKCGSAQKESKLNYGRLHKLTGKLFSRGDK